MNTDSKLSRYIPLCLFNLLKCIFSNRLCGLSMCLQPFSFLETPLAVIDKRIGRKLQNWSRFKSSRNFMCELSLDWLSPTPAKVYGQKCERSNLLNAVVFYMINAPV